MTFEIIIETFNEEFEVIDETETLEEAMKIAKEYPIEKYKSIFIHQIDYDGGVMKVYEV